MIEQIDYYHGLGLQVFPAKWPSKAPCGQWGQYQNQQLTLAQARAYFAQHGKTAALGFIVGAASGGVEVIDVDCKYDLTGNLFSELWQLIEGNLPELAPLFPVVRTASGGYHIYYRCEVNEGNKQLAKRPTTDAERAEPGREKERVVVLVETRGQGGFIVAPPTPGYTLERGSFDAIPQITPEQRATLFAIGRSLNELPEQPQPEPSQPRPATAAEGDELTPWADFNNRGDLVGLLESHGWSKVRERGKRVYLKRPGAKSETSGNFHTDLRTLFVFSSSTDFEAEKPYSPFDAFKVLERITNNGEAAVRLRTMGYGAPKAVRSARAKTVRVEATDANGEGQNLATDGVVTEDAVRSSAFESAFVYYTLSSDKAEVIANVELLEAATGARVYLREVGDLGNPGEGGRTLRPFEYRLEGIFTRYAEAVARGVDGVPDPIEEDELFEEFVDVGAALSNPVDLDLYKGMFARFVEVNDLRITPESINARLAARKVAQQREKQATEVKGLIAEAANLQSKGQTTKALDLLIGEGKKLTAQNKADLFSKLTTPTSSEQIRARIAKKPVELKTGYTIEGEELTLPTGAITIIAAPTSHGKTTLMGNLALRVCHEMPDKAVYFLSYEEEADAVTVSLLSSHIGEALSSNNRRTIKSYYRGEDYFATGKRAAFEAAEPRFFADLIEPGRLSIQYVDYDSDTLCEALRYLAKEGNGAAVFIDYMQLLHKGTQGNNKYASRQLELQQICLDLKDVAVETGLALIVGAQFNREVVNPARLHPTKIREAADIEQIAHLILGFWNNNQKPLANKEEADDLKHYDYRKDAIYLEVLKYRSGTPGRSEMLSFDGNIGLIKNFETSTWGADIVPGF